MNSTDYQYWQACLADTEKPELVIGKAECGFWRQARRSGGFDPVAIWRDINSKHLIARLGFKSSSRIVECDEDFCERIFSWIVKNPVTEEAYRSAFETSRWPDDAPDIGIGHNLPDDPCEAIRVELEAEREAVDEFLKNPIADQENADKAATWSGRIAETVKRADALRVDEKRPYDDASKAVQAKWKPLVDMGDALAKRLKSALTPFLREQQRKAAEEAARAAQAQEVVKPVENSRAGKIGRTVALRTITRARITDPDALFQAIKDYPDMRAEMQRIADRVVAAGGVLPGVEKVTEQKAV